MYYRSTIDGKGLELSIYVLNRLIVLLSSLTPVGWGRIFCNMSYCNITIGLLLFVFSIILHYICHAVEIPRNAGGLKRVTVSAR
ncbi:hypothetical protein IX324_001581 [Bacteroides pyogenes]|nr:hypothetical protein [Bacteroides pyogenes]